MNTGIVIVCDECGSDDVTHNAVATWSVAEQKWVIEGPAEGQYCFECGDEAYLVERPLYLKDYAKLAIEKEEAHGLSQ